jgi:phosphoheptose isomerase
MSVVRNSRMCSVVGAIGGGAGQSTAGDQKNATVASDDANGSVVVWSSYYTTAGRSNDIMARRLDPLGGFVGEEFPVNVTTEGNQTEPAVAVNSSGTFAVAWQGPGPDQEDIFLRFIDLQNQLIPEEKLVNVSTAGRQLYPSIALSDAGACVAAWESREVVADVNRSFIYTRVFDSNGTGGDETIADSGEYDGRYPDVAMNGRGGFALAWLQERTTNAIMARLFDANGVPITGPLDVSTAAITSLTRPAVAMNSAGYFVVAWDGDPNRASDDDIYARCYDPEGTPLSEPFLVNTVRTGRQELPQVAINDANEFIVVWVHDTQDPDAATDIFARRFDGAGQPAGDPFQLNAYTQDQQRYPDVALMNDGSFLAAWESNGQDGSGYGIFLHVAPAIGP